MSDTTITTEVTTEAPEKKLTVTEQKNAAATAKAESKPKTSSGAVPKAKATIEPQFSKLVNQLSKADAASKSLSADSSAARAEKNAVAVVTIKAAYAERLDVESVRKALLDGGVLKGTVSKITTILSALRGRLIKPSDVKSLNGAYTIVKEIEKIEKANTVAPGGFNADGEPFAVAPEPVVATTPDEAFEVILNAIRSVTDADEAFTLAGEWITRFTNGVSEVLKDKDSSAE